VLLQGYLASLSSTVESLQQGTADMAASSSSLADKLSQAYGEADQRKQDAAATKVSDAYKVCSAHAQCPPSRCVR
jgi:hypothetical protein